MKSCGDFPYAPKDATPVSNSNDYVPYCELNNKPISRFYSYRSRYGERPKCVLNYMDETCTDFAQPDLPKDAYLSEFGLEYENWKHGVKPPGRWNFYQDTLFGANKKRMSHPFLYKNPSSWAIPKASPFEGLFGDALGGKEGFMGCGATGNAYIAILTLFVLFLVFSNTIN